MSFGRYSRGSRGGGGAPPWLVFLLGVALVFGLFYLWQGTQTFFRTGGLGVSESTQRAGVVASSTADRVERMATSTAPVRPSATAIPPCQAFRVVVVGAPSAIVREAPRANAPVVTQIAQGEEICVLGREGESEFYVLDLEPENRRLELAYIHESVVDAVNPTPTITRTPTPLATVTSVPSATLTLTPRITATPTPAPASARATAIPESPEPELTLPR